VLVAEGRISGPLRLAEPVSESAPHEGTSDINRALAARKSPEITRPLKAIRAYCLHCMGMSRDAVAECWTVTCPVHPFRFGRNPNHRRRLSDEEKVARSARLGRGGVGST
jgi:hypothetical protein